MMVMVMLVPVSPSGTGKTFSSLIHSFFDSRFFAPARNILAKSAAFIVFISTTSSSLIYRSDTFYINIDLMNLHTGKFFDFIFDIVDQIVCNRRNADAIRHNHMKIK